MLKRHDEQHPMAQATFAAGCFWGVEAAFRKLPGVVSAQVGYIGGSTDEPTYRTVCAGTTGHAEAVEVEYDPARISYETLLESFWAQHNPSAAIGPGSRRKDQYRSAIFFHTPEQQAAALASRDGLARSGRYKDPIGTEIASAPEFHRAEEYHQRYREKQHGFEPK